MADQIESIENVDNLQKKPNSENEKKIESLSELSLADHVVLVFNENIYCHCIVESINTETNILNIIYYDDGNVECGIYENTENAEEKKDDKCQRKPGAKKTEISYNSKKFQIYKVIYGPHESCLSSAETLAKANDFIGQKKYNVFENNDEHFAIYCKTGKAGKLFVLDPQDVNPNELFGGNLAKKITGNLAQTGTQVILVNTAKHIATSFPRSVAAAALPAVAEAAGSVLGIGVEGITMGYDIHKKYKANKEGKLSTIKFKKYIAKRVTRGTFGVAGGIGGGIVGQMVIPVPVVGALVGGFVGGLLGAAVGQGQGILIGELVEKIDTKVKEKKQNDEISEKQEYKVLNNLVFKFDKNVFSETPSTVETSKFYVDTENSRFYDEADEKKPTLNNNDYDIYVINNANDTVFQKPLDESEISNIELPLDFNVYVSLEKK